MALLEKELLSAPTPENWQQVVDKLFDDVTRWAHEWLNGSHAGPGGGVRLSEIEIYQEQITALTIDIPPRAGMLVPKEELVFEPRLLNASAGLGFVDFYVYPARHRVRLVYQFRDQNWSVKTDSGLYWPHPWGKSTFEEIAEGFLRA